MYSFKTIRLTRKSKRFCYSLVRWLVVFPLVVFTLINIWPLLEEFKSISSVHESPNNQKGENGRPTADRPAVTSRKDQDPSHVSRKPRQNKPLESQITKGPSTQNEGTTPLTEATTQAFPRIRVLPMSYRVLSLNYRVHNSSLVQCMRPELLRSNSDYLLTREEVPYLPGLKNPCFCVGDFGRIETGTGLVSVNASGARGDSAQLYCLPYFFLAGTEKCGTGDFYKKLAQHQDIYGPMRKEAQWFNDLKHKITFPMHQGTLEGYTSMFDRHLADNQEACHGTTHIQECLQTHGDGAKCPQILGDFTPRYIVDGYKWKEKWFHKDLDEPMILVPHKIRYLLPNAKIIMIFRDPVERLLSSYRYFKFHTQGGKSARDFNARALGQVTTWKRCVANVTNIRLCMYDYVAMDPPIERFWSENSHDQLRYGLYYLYVKEWLEVFPREQFLFLQFEEYALNPIGILQNRVLPFLEMEPFSPKALNRLWSWEENDKVFNVRAHIPEDMYESTRRALYDFYRPYNGKLAQLLQDSKFLWRQ